MFLAQKKIFMKFSKFDEILLQGDNLISVNKKNKSFGIPMIIGLKARFFEKFIFSKSLRLNAHGWIVKITVRVQSQEFLKTSFFCFLCFLSFSKFFRNN